MLPRLSRQNAMDTMLANAKFVRKFLLSKAGGAYFSNIRFAKFRIIMILTLLVICAVPAFVHHISYIVGMSSNREMSWINAGWIVTGMHDLHSNGDHAFMFNYPGNAIGHVHFPSVMDTEKSLASFVFGTKPWPTIMGCGLFNFTPKTYFKDLIKHEVYIHSNESCFKSLKTSA